MDNRISELRPDRCGHAEHLRAHDLETGTKMRRGAEIKNPEL